MVRCTFCNKEIEKGTGKIFVFKSAKVANFCSSKCERNMLNLKRKPENLKWAKK